MRTPIALTIAGSDSGGGAGIQADIKTFSVLGAYGCSVITALTAQNTRGVSGILNVPAAFIGSQIDAVFSDLAVSAVKIGMLSTASAINMVAEKLERWRPPWIVLDPVMVAKSGDRLLEEDAVTALRDRLLPLASIITPNLPEAADLLDLPMPTERSAMVDIGRRLQELGPSNVLLKGGHLQGDCSPDLLLHGADTYWMEASRIPTGNTHGTGCTLSAAIAARLACQAPLPQAVMEAKAYIEGAIKAADQLRVGHGHGPVHHFFRWWDCGK